MRDEERFCREIAGVRVVPCSLLSGARIIALVLFLSGTAAAQGFLWSGFAENAQHVALSSVPSQPLAGIRWQLPIDLDPQYTHGDLLAHYGSPMITAGNTVVVPVKTTASGGFQIAALSGADGAQLWTASSNYVVPPNTGTWFPSYGPALTSAGLLYYPGADGSVYRLNVHSAQGGPAPARLSFYNGPLDSHVYIDTPITSDLAGNIYFGYEVAGTPSLPELGTGGIARVSASGVGSFVSAAAATGDPSMSKAVENCGPAVSADGASVYIAMNSQSLGTGYLLQLNSSTLATIGKVVPIDAMSGQNAPLRDDGTSSPVLGPDGDVYFGAFDKAGTSRGWLEHYSANLATTKTPGGFGWDNTPTVVPASMVSSYHGTSPYLLMSKYNNYVEHNGAGQNMIAILDPNAPTTDDQRANPTGAIIMQTVLTQLGPTPSPEGGVYEWCDSNAVVDPATDSVLITSEDGRLYRWNLTTNTLTESITLGSGLDQAYTPTLIGPDGGVYAMSNGLLSGVGVPLTTWTGVAGAAWDSTTPNWAGGSPAIPTIYADGANVIFGDKNPITGTTVANTGGMATVTIQPSGVQPAWITFTNSGAAAGGVDYTIGGGSIGGSTGISLDGLAGVGGAVYLTSANSFTGAVEIHAGRLNLQNAAALGNSSGVWVGFGGSLELQNAGGSPMVFGTTVAGAAPIPLSLAGAGTTGALVNIVGDNAYAGPISVGLGSGGATIASLSTGPGDLLTLADGISVAPGATLTLAGAGNTTISNGALVLTAATADGSAAMAVQGPGTVEIQSAPTLGDGSTIQVSGGRLRFNVTAGAATIGTGVTATISSGATLELAGSVSALSSSSNHVKILNDSAASQGGLLVSGQDQRVGSNTGSGTTVVTDGASLLADRIVQQALTIGGTATSPAFVEIAASDINGNPVDLPSAEANDVALTGSFLSSEPPALVATDFEAAIREATRDGSETSARAVPEPKLIVLLAAGLVALVIVAPSERTR